MPARSVICLLVNGTSKQLTLDTQSQNLSHGEWSGGLMPPNSIAPGGFAKWGSESDGFMTGTEGSLSYAIEGSGKLQLHWDNPYAGSNSYGYTTPPGFNIEQHGGNGDNATVFWMLTG